MSKDPALARSLVRDLVPFKGRRAAKLVPRRQASGPMPWVIAIMIALTVMAAAAGLALGNLADRARSDLSGALTVQIIEADRPTRLAMVERAEALLKQDAAVASLRVIPEQELAAMLEPWIGAADGDANAIPIPSLIDVQLTALADTAEVARLNALLIEQVPGARVDAQADWLRPVYDALSALQYLALALIALLALTSAGAVWLAARSSFNNHRETVEIIHLLGGTDHQIMRIFQRSVTIDAFVGGVIGFVLGSAAVLLIGGQFAAIDSGMVAGGNLHDTDWLLLVAIPLFGVLLAMFTARITVMSALKRML